MNIWVWGQILNQPTNWGQRGQQGKRGQPTTGRGITANDGRKRRGYG